MASAADARPMPSSLREELSAVLPEGFPCKIRHVYTPSKRCDSLFSPTPGHEPDLTRLASHFLTVSIDSQHQADSDGANTALVYGVEALIYSTRHLTTIFVSKADSTGYLPHQKPSPVKLITTTFLKWLSSNERQRHPTRKLVISLFARSQSQYLFPGSAENSTKHVLDDRQLVKWWARVLDPLIQSPEAESCEYDGYITVPGFEGSEVRPFFPPSHTSSPERTHWHSGDPLLELARTRGVSSDAPARCLLPRFPDDPKARFMQDLDDEAGIAEDASATVSPSKRKGGRWTSVRDLRTFWETMAFRQECSSGRLVGFIWLVIRPKRDEAAVEQSDGAGLAKTASQDSSVSAASQVSPGHASSLADGGSPSKKRRKPLTGPIVPRQPRLKGGSSSLTASDLSGMLDGNASNGLVLTPEGYDKVMQTLLHLDFANLEVATQSTSKWIAEVAQTCNRKSDWAVEVVGVAKLERVAEQASSNGGLPVNDLGSMIRKKKRKVDEAVSEGHAAAEVRVETAGEEVPAVNILSSGMLRKKPKTAVG